MVVYGNRDWGLWARMAREGRDLHGRDYVSGGEGRGEMSLETILVRDLPGYRNRTNPIYDEILATATTKRAVIVPAKKGENIRVIRQRIRERFVYYKISVRTQIDYEKRVVYVWLKSKGGK